MKQIILCIVCLLVGAGAGLVGWMIYTNPKTLESQQQIADLQTQLQDAQDKVEADKKASETQIAKLQSDLKQSRTQTTFAATQLRKMQSDLKLLQLELNRLKTQSPAEESAPLAPASTGLSPAATPATRTTLTTRTTATKPATPAGVKEYTIQNGDSFWKIAANELGNGARYTEIIKLNPGMTEKSKLDIGQKIKIPAE
jgi:nucleoid-associated protein YgaU